MTALQSFESGLLQVNGAHLETDLMQDDITAKEERYNEEWRLHNKLMEDKGIK